MGSLREALFLTVWLRRAQAEALKVKMVAAGIADVTAANNGETRVDKFWESYMSVTFPFMEKDKAQQDAAMVARMQKEVAKGAVSFAVQDMPNPLKERVKKMSLEPGFAQRMRERGPNFNRKIEP